MKRLGVIILILVGIVAAVSNFPSPSFSAGNEIAQYCRTKSAAAATGLQTWVSNGTVKSVTKARIGVEDKKWETIPHNAKVSIAIYSYCNAIAGSASDSATVLIRGYRDGALKGAIVDGNYSDG